MLLRMYLRWAERKGINALSLTKLPAKKRHQIRHDPIRGRENAYGLLAGETGVHRLVRISPFDQAARRHTSFASVSSFPKLTTASKSTSVPKTCA